jgi:two-component system OmpR family sensor kinase
MKLSLRTWSLRSRLTLGIVILTAIAFAAASFATQSLLKGYLISEVDKELSAIADASVPRIERGGLGRNYDDDLHEVRQRFSLGPAAPLNRIPTTASLTLLDPSGAVIGGLGGDLGTTRVADYLVGLIPQEVASHDNEPFTIEATGADFRVIARPLNTGETVVAAQNLGELEKTLDRLGALFGLIALLLLILIAFASRAVIRISMKPLKDVEETAAKIAAGNLSARMTDADSNTEVGRLATSLNAMLSRIEEAFAVRTDSENKLRRFVADASHELRTPITAIRGFSELHRQGAVTGEKETSELIGRIENESKRMGSLVEDLLLLARLDQSRQMSAEPVNLSKLVLDAVESARAAGPNHPVTFKNSDEEIYALGDNDRIHQVVANLLANARTHTPAGTLIDVSVSQGDDGVRIRIADNGPGLSKKDQERIFERFYRADSSRVRTDGEGTGLGLSIVDAVMRAHAGQVSVESEIGKGAAFTLFFPVSA